MSRFLKQRPPQGLAAALSSEQRGKLIEWLKEPANSYRQLVVLLSEHFGIVTSQSAIAGFLKRHTAEILVPQPVAMPVAAAGVTVTITCLRPGEVKLSVHPLQPGDMAAADAADAAELRADGVEIVAICQREGEVKLAVFPQAGPPP